MPLWCFSWVGYEKEGYRGHQYLLEEGEYHDWRVWGGDDSELRSARVIRAVGWRQKNTYGSLDRLSHSHTQKIIYFLCSYSQRLFFLEFSLKNFS